MPLRSLGIRDQCPACLSEIQIPTLDESVSGWSQLVPKVPIWISACPSCQADVHLPYAQIDKVHICTTCGQFLDVGLRPAARQAQQEPVTPPVQVHQPEPTPRPDAPPSFAEAAAQARATGQFAPHPGPGAGEPPQPPPRQQRPSDNGDDERLLARSPFVGFEEPDRDPEAADEPIVLPEPTPSRSARTSSGLRISPRIMRYVIGFGIWLGPMLLWFFTLMSGGMSAGDAVASGICLVFPWFLFGGWVAYFFTPVLLSAFYPAVRCPGCGEQQQAVNRWFCGCGYHDHRERNIFFFRCPSCRKKIGHFNCPRCDSTILI